MSRRSEGEQNPFLKRVEIVMKVQMGQLTVTEAAGELGVSRTYYYQLEEEMLQAALGAVTPRKPGPKPPEINPEVSRLEEKLKEAQRERELLQIKVKHLQEIQRDMIKRGIGVLREKKRSNPADRRRHRKKVHRSIQADGAVEGGGTAGARGHGQGAMPGVGTSPGEPMAVETKGGQNLKAGTKAPGE